MLEEELEPVAPVDVVDEKDALPLDQLEFEDDVGQEEFVHF